MVMMVLILPEIYLKLVSKKLKKYGIEEYFEMGPGKVLSSLGKQNRLEGSFSAFDNIDTFKEKISAYGK